MYDYVVTLTRNGESLRDEPKRALLCGYGAAAYLMRKLLPKDDGPDDNLWCDSTSYVEVRGDRLTQLQDALTRVLGEVREHPDTWQEERGFDGVILHNEGRLVPMFHDVQRAALERFLTDALAVVSYADEHRRTVLIDGGR